MDSEGKHGNSSEGFFKGFQEREHPPNTVLHLVSDLHGLPPEQLSELLDKLERVQSDRQRSVEDKERVFTILMGDLPTSGVEDRLIEEFKKAGGSKSKLSLDNVAEKELYDENVKKRGGTPRAGAYLATKLRGQEALRALRERLDKNRDVARCLRELSNPIVIPGNAETNAPYDTGLAEAYKQEHVPYYEEPRIIDLGQRALVIWPSFKDPKSYSPAERKLFEDAMAEKTRELARSLVNKKEIIIVTHEQPFFGSRKYKEKVKEAGYQPYGAPYKGVNPSHRQIKRLIVGLPQDCKVGLAFGHLHSQQDVVLAGTGLQLPQTNAGGMGDLAIYSKPIEGGDSLVKKVALFYVPQGDVGEFVIGQDGFQFNLVK